MLMSPIKTGLEKTPIKVVRRQNVYFGKNSVLKLTLPSGNPDKVDAVEDLLALIYAWAVDSLTGKGMLTHYEPVDGQYVVLQPFNRYVVNGRAKVLHRLVSKVKNMGGNPAAWHQFISQLNFLIRHGEKARAWKLLTDFASSTGTTSLLNAIKAHIEEVKSKKVIYRSEIAG